MATRWKDSNGRRWAASINLADVGRIRRTYNVDLLDGRALAKLADDPMVLVGVLWELHSGEAEAAGIEPEAFADGLRGDALERAADAVGRELADLARCQAEAIEKMCRARQ